MLERVEKLRQLVLDYHNLRKQGRHYHQTIKAGNFSVQKNMLESRKRVEEFVRNFNLEELLEILSLAGLNVEGKSTPELKRSLSNLSPNQLQKILDSGLK